MAVGPNFSHFLDVPRHDNLFNRKRQLLCLSEFVEAGAKSRATPECCSTGGLAFLGPIFGRKPSVTVVAMEFETGNRVVREGERAIDGTGATATSLWPTPSPTCHRWDAVFGTDRFGIRGRKFRGFDAFHEDGTPPVFPLRSTTGECSGGDRQRCLGNRWTNCLPKSASLLRLA